MTKGSRGPAIARPEKAPDPAHVPFIPPCLATAARRPPGGPHWVYEIKYDGYRAQAHIADGEVRLLTRAGLDWTDRLGRVRAELAAIDARSAVIDGELIVEDARGAPDFQALQRELRSGPTARVVFVAFDLLRLDADNISGRPLLERKAELRRLITNPDGGLLRFSDHLVGDGEEILRHVCSLGLEGIVCKRTDRPYRSGRSTDWIKVKCVPSERFVVGGYVEQSGADELVGSLVLGFFRNGQLQYAGRVGTGFSSGESHAIWQALQAVRRARPPFAATLDREQRDGVVWVEPRLVVEVEHRGWTHGNRLRHSVFRGFDRDAAAIDVGPPASWSAR